MWEGSFGCGFFYFGQFVRRGWVVGGGVFYGYFRELLTLLAFFYDYLSYACLIYCIILCNTYNPLLLTSHFSWTS